MTKKSAGILLFRTSSGELEVFLVHPGGPFWVNKDEGVWSIPKGEFDDNEDAFAAAKREFLEETGFTITGNYVALTPVKQSNFKMVYAWALQGDCDAQSLVSNAFDMEWPPNSGTTQSFPEVDRGNWFSLTQAQNKIVKGQLPLLVELQNTLKS